MTVTIDIVRQLLAGQFMRGNFENGTVELIGTSFIANEPAIFGKPNEDYIRREIEWYLTEVPNIDFLEHPIPAIWQAVASADGDVNSQYGFLVFNDDNGGQYNHVLNELRHNPGSRRGTMVYNRPSIHTDATRDGMNDFICTNAVNYFVREDDGGESVLDAVVQMRSNDAVFGYRNDWAWQRYVLERLAQDLEVAAGDLVWQAASLHVYERHFPLITEYMHTRDSL